MSYHNNQKVDVNDNKDYHHQDHHHDGDHYHHHHHHHHHQHHDHLNHNSLTSIAVDTQVDSFHGLTI